MILVDGNVPLHATNEDAPLHHEARASLEQGADAGTEPAQPPAAKRARTNRRSTSG